MVNSKNSFSQPTKGFTLIELLVVIAILAVLMSVVVITINPAEMLKKSRDSRRVSDLDALRTALNLYLSEDLTFTLADSAKAYASIPQASAGTCNPALSYCGGAEKTCYCTTTASYRNVDATGWAPVNFKAITLGSALSALPIDPTNNTTYYYLFAASSSKIQFELNAKLEAVSNVSLMANDGGSTSTWYEIGSDLTILN